MPLMIQIQCNV